MAIRQPIDAALEVVAAFEDLGIRYHLGGSYASSVHGVPRQTHDVDIVAELETRHATLLALKLQDRFYLDVEMIRSRLLTGKSFNLLHLESAFKVDVFPLKDGAFDREEFRRSELRALADGTERAVFVKSAEDILLRKLEWYRLGREVSDRQWNDILGLVKAQGALLDSPYLRRWAAELGIEDLLARALGTI